MFGRGLGMLLALSAAIGVPYALSTTGVAERIASGERSPSALLGGSSAGGNAGAAARGNETEHASTVVLPELPGLPLAGPSVAELGEIFRFDVTTAWVMGRWPRVSTQLADLELQGYRVPLVTGTREDDLAGSLTYYFDREQRVQRITFFGTTGDARRLVATLATRHRFLRELTDDAGLFLYQVKYNGKPLSELRVRPANVVEANNPHGRFEVALDMRPRPG